MLTFTRILLAQSGNQVSLTVFECEPTDVNIRLRSLIDASINNEFAVHINDWLIREYGEMKINLFSPNLPAILYLLAVCLCVQHDCVYCARFHVSPSKSRELTSKGGRIDNVPPEIFLDHPPKRIRKRVTNEKTLVLSIVFAENRVLRLTFVQQQSWVSNA